MPNSPNMPKPRRKPPRELSVPRLTVTAGLWLILVLCAVGFAHFTQVTLFQQAHFAPESEHPWDWYAMGCLFLGMGALAGLLLNRRDPPPMRWRRIASSHFRQKQARRRAKRGRRSGTIGLP